MEELKQFDELLTPDIRASYFVYSHNNIGSQPQKLNERYLQVESIKLIDDVPESIQSQFNVARMLCIYSWLYYPFHQIAELKAYSSLEMGLRIKFNKPKDSLKAMLQKAVDDNLVNDSSFGYISPNESDNKYSSQMPESISKRRNDLAHGSNTLLPSSVNTLKICAAIINQIYVQPPNPLHHAE